MIAREKMKEIMNLSLHNSVQKTNPDLAGILHKGFGKSKERKMDLGLIVHFSIVWKGNSSQFCNV